MSSQDKNLPYEILTLSHFGFKYCSVKCWITWPWWFFEIKTPVLYSNLTITVQRQMRKAFCRVVLAQPVVKANLSFGSTHHFLSVSPGDVLSRWEGKWRHNWVKLFLKEHLQMQGRQGEIEPRKVKYSTPNFFDRLFLLEHIETQNLGLPALICKCAFLISLQ